MRGTIFGPLFIAVFALSAGSVLAGVISPNNFGPSAQIETFDSQSVGSNSGALSLNGVTYDFSPSGYRIVAVDHANYLCVAGTCLGNNASGAFWTITLSNPVDRVGGYLSGAGDSLVASQTDITYYDANNVLLGGAFHPIPQTNTASSPAFFGFESDADPIKFVRIHPSGGPFVTTLDNFTTEILAPVPLGHSTWPMTLLGLACVGFMAHRRKSGMTTRT
jgi:hypothetical protein